MFIVFVTFAMLFCTFCAYVCIVFVVKGPFIVFFKRASALGFQIPNFQNDLCLFEGEGCRILEGKRVAEDICQQAQTLSLQYTVKPCLAVILVGDNPASLVYVNNKLKAFTKVGFHVLPTFLPKHTTQTDLEDLIDSLNQNFKIHGILVQLPLPSPINTQTVLNRIHTHKDVDGFLPYNMGNAVVGHYDGVLACTPFGVLTLLHAYGIPIAQKSALVVGRSNIVGKPVASLLLNQNATVTIAHSYTQNLKKLCQESDIIIVAAGQPELITPEMISSHTVVIDVGMNKKPDGTLCGDVHPGVKAKAAALTPVPKGVGPMTIAMLIVNTAIAAWCQKTS
jgi:methylenetetrahydrofolate dehydrogenase (NADP+) / methenyltetrahydrofolate cyclohydrolase